MLSLLIVLFVLNRQKHISLIITGGMCQVPVESDKTSLSENILAETSRTNRRQLERKTFQVYEST